MFADTKTLLSTRKLRVEELLSLIRDCMADEIARRAVSWRSKNLKGLLVVQVYAAYEAIIVSAYHSAAQNANLFYLDTNFVHLGLVAMASDPEFQRLSAVKPSMSWSTRLQVLSRSALGSQMSLDPDKFPKDDNHFRSGQIELLYELFGIVDLPWANQMERSQLDQLVNERNDVAHGALTPEEVGGRYSVSDLAWRKELIFGVLSKIVFDLETQCSMLVNLHR